MKIPKIRFVVSVLFVAVCLLPVPGRSQGRVGFIDPYRIVAESEMGKIARRDMARIREQKQKYIRRSLDAIKAMKAGLTPGNATDPDSDYEALREKYEQHNQLVAAVNRELEQENETLVRLIIARADKILTRLAKDKGFVLVIKDPGVVGYLDPDADLTDLVIRELNRRK